MAMSAHISRKAATIRRQPVNLLEAWDSQLGRLQSKPVLQPNDLSVVGMWEKLPRVSKGHLETALELYLEHGHPYLAHKVVKKITDMNLPLSTHSLVNLISLLAVQGRWKTIYKEWQALPPATRYDEKILKATLRAGRNHYEALCSSSSLQESSRAATVKAQLRTIRNNAASYSGRNANRSEDKSESKKSIRFQLSQAMISLGKPSTKQELLEAINTISLTPCSPNSLDQALYSGPYTVVSRDTELRGKKTILLCCKRAGDQEGQKD